MNPPPLGVPSTQTTPFTGFTETSIPDRTASNRGPPASPIRYKSSAVVSVPGAASG